MLRKLYQVKDGIRYGLPNLARPQLPLGARAKAWLTAFRKDGIVRINKPELDEAAAALDGLHFRLLSQKGFPERLGAEELGGEGRFAERFRGDYGRALEEGGAGAENLYYASLRDPAVAKAALDEEVLTLIYNYYRRQPYFRNQPFLSTVRIDKRIDLETSPALFHVDHLRQVTGMFLVSDTTMETTHMEYVRGSHDRRYWGQPFLDRAQCEAAVRAAGPARIASLVGPAGTLYLFDAGGIHRRVHHPGSERRILHFNMTTGHSLRPGLEHFKAGAFVESLPPLIRRALSRL